MLKYPHRFARNFVAVPPSPPTPSPSTGGEPIGLLLALTRSSSSSSSTAGQPVGLLLVLTKSS